jgi:signal transduction histidine kinase
VYWLYSDDARGWTGRPPSEKQAASEQLAAATEKVYARWGGNASTFTAGRDQVELRDGVFVVLRQAAGDTPVVLIATAAFAERHWLAASRSAVHTSHIDVTLGVIRADSPGATAPSNGKWTVWRSPADTGLPWSIAARTREPIPETRAFTVRRRLLVSGLVLLATVVFIASYFVMRGISRELALARLQSDFVAAVSHEFRTPLTSLRQFTDMLKDNPDLGPERRRLAYDVQSRSTDRLMRLVESLLDLGKMEAAAPAIAPTLQDCADLIGGVVRDFRTETAATGQTVDFSAAGRAMAMVDAEALTRAVRNLLDNAVKYSPGHEPVEVNVRGSHDEVTIRVADHGIGIPADERARIFSKFHRGEQARRRGIKGTGIGLALVAEIVRAHRGRVSVDSAEGTGSVFTITLPAAGDHTHRPVSMDTSLAWPES